MGEFSRNYSQGEMKPMAKDGTKQAREENKRARRNGGADAAESAPLVSAKRGKFETVERAKIEALVFARLGDYKQFVAEIEGEEPEDGAIISAGLEMLFDADEGFEWWAAEERRKNRNGTSAPANGNGAKGSTTTAAAG